MSKEFDQLAAVLKSCGIVASQYDAKMMAENINDGVRQNSAYYADAYRRIMGTGKREESRHPLPDTDSNITSHIHRDPQIENVPFEPENEIFSNQAEAPFETLSEATCIDIDQPMQAGEPAEALSCDEVAEAQEIAESILREKEVESPSPMVIESPETEVGIEIMPIAEVPAQISPEPIAAAPSLHSSGEDMQLMAKQMAEQMMQQMAAQQAEQQKALVAQIERQQRMIEQMNAQQAVMKEALNKPAPQSQQVSHSHQAVVQEKPKQVFTYPAREESRKGSGYFREIPVDKSRPKPTLTKEEEKATDITHWFNFSKRQI